MSFMVNKYSRSDGVALIGIIIAIVLMGLLGGGVLMLITTGSMESLQTMNWSKAFFAAESGISAAKYQITTNASWYTNTTLPRTTTGMIGSASFTTAIATNATNVVISSTGVQGDPPSRWTSRWSPAGGEITRALLMYQQGTLATPRYRICSNLRRLSNEFTANTVAAAAQWQRIIANPLTNEFLLVLQNSQRRIYAKTYSNGIWRADTQLSAVQVPVVSSRAFDVAYENLSGRGMVVYSINSATPQYRLWTSNSWSAPSNINVGATNAIYWIRLISKPGTNEIMCLARWRKTTNPQGNYSSAIIWNGSIWTNYIPLERQVGTVGDLAYETFDGAYASTTNQALVAYINGPTLTQPKYRTYTSAGWSAEKTNSALGGNGTSRWIRVEYSPNSALAYAGFLHSGTRLQGAYWTNGGWSGYNNFSNLNIATSARRAFDIVWSSQTNTLMVVYSRNDQDAQSYMLTIHAGSPESSTNDGSLVSTGSGDRGQWCVLKADPFTSEFYYLAIDNRSDVNLQRWTGSDWTLFPEPEATSALTYLSIDFTFRRDSASRNCWPVR